MNRYSNLSVSQFNPLSLNEILQVPLFKQRQYDQLEADRVATQESFKVDPRDPFVDKAKQLQADFNAKADELARYQLKTGDLQGARSKMLDLRKEYKRLTDPMGEVAQINAEKLATEAEVANYIKNATAMKFSPDRVQLDIKNQLASHDKNSLYSDKGMINKFTAKLPHKYENYIDETKALMKETGMSSSEIKTLTDEFQHDLVNGDYTKAVNKLRASSSNKDQRGSVVDFIVNKITNPNSDMRKTMDYEGIDLNTALTDINNLSGIYKKDSVHNEDGFNYGNVQRPSSGDGNDKDSFGMPIIEKSNTYSPNQFAGATNSSNQTRLKELNNKTNLTPEELKERSELKTFQENVNKSLLTIPEYQKTNKEYSNFKNNLSQNVKKLIEDPLLRVSAEFQITNTPNIFNVKTPNGTILKGNDGKVLNFTAKQMELYYDNRDKAYTYENKLNNIADKTVRENNIQEHGYQLIPTTTKEETSLKLMNNAFQNATKGSENFLNLVNIESIDTNAGSRRSGSKLELDDKKNIQALINQLPEGSVKITSFIPKGGNGKPQYMLSIDTKEGVSADLNKYLRNDDGSGIIGDGSTINMKVSFKKSKGDVVNNINGYVQEYLSTKGEINPNTKRPIGHDLALDIRANADKAELNDQLNSNKWSDIITTTTDFSKLNPFIVKQLQQELNITDSDTDSTLKNKITNFIKAKGNRQIYIE